MMVLPSGCVTTLLLDSERQRHLIQALLHGTSRLAPYVNETANAAWGEGDNPANDLTTSRHASLIRSVRGSQSRELMIPV